MMIKIYVPRKEIPGYYLTPFGDRHLPKEIKYNMAGIKEITKIIYMYLCDIVVKIYVGNNKSR